MESPGRACEIHEPMIRDRRRTRHLHIEEQIKEQALNQIYDLKQIFFGFKIILAGQK